MEKREKDIQGTARLHQLSRCWEAPLAARDDLLELAVSWSLFQGHRPR